MTRTNTLSRDRVAAALRGAAACGTMAAMNARTGALLVLLPLCAGAAPRPWEDYRTILWIGDSIWKRPEQFPVFAERLREMGVNTGMVYGDADPAPWLDQRLPYYVENIVNRGLCLKWNSKVRDWDAFVTGWAKDRSKDAFVREYPLQDPAWRDGAAGQVRAAAARHRAHAPLAYDLRDELSVTLSANPFDYDFSPVSLAAFRAWLRAQHGSLEALNAAWATSFPSWDAVVPFSTDEIKNRMAGGGALPRGQPDWQALARTAFEPDAARQDSVRWNFAPWCDFRTFMDLTLAETLDTLRRASHAVDPETPVGIEGTQMPHAFGGYDLWRLSQVLDWVEPYDICDARAILGSFMPGKPMLCTVGEADAAAARRRLWHLLLEGDRGCIVWWSEDCIDGKSPDLALTPRARALAPVLREMTGDLARLFLRARREFDPVAIHYSQASIQVAWLLESTVDGRTWHRRFSSYEATHNRHAALRHRWLRDLEAAGFSPRFVSYAQIESGELERGEFRALLLPGSFALSDREVERIRAFAAGTGRALVYDGEAGAFDGRGRLRAKPVFPAHPAPAKPSAELAGIAPPVRISPAGTPARVCRYRLGPARLLAIERLSDAQVGEDLKPLGGAEKAAGPLALEVSWAGAAHVVALRDGRYLGHTNRVALLLNPAVPSLLALTPERLAGPPVQALAGLAGQ